MATERHAGFAKAGLARLKQVIYYTRDRDNQIMQWQTSGQNKAAAKRMMKPWAQSLREGLDESRSDTRKE